MSKAKKKWCSFAGKYNKQIMCDRILREDIMKCKNIGIPKDQVVFLLQTGNFKRVENEIKQLIDEVYGETVIAEA